MSQIVEPARIELNAVAPDLGKAIQAAYAPLLRAALDRKLIDLVFLRVSQINGCAYCVDLHAHDLRKAGESARRINALSAWHETRLFDAAERAALTWAEAVTRIVETHAPDAVYQSLCEHFSERQIGELTYAIALMNMLNRTGIALRKALPEPEAAAWPGEQGLVA